MDINQTMGCDDCARKHLALALSLGKEVLSGHGKGGSPDHRPDFIGELVNAEHHLLYNHKDLAERVRELRLDFQAVECTPAAEQLDGLRMIWLDTFPVKEEKASREIEPSWVKAYQDAPPVSLHVTYDPDDWNDDDLELLDKLFRKWAVNYAGLSGDITGILRSGTERHIWWVPAGVFPVGPVDLIDDTGNPPDEPHGKNSERVCKFSVTDILELLVTDHDHANMFGRKDRVNLVPCVKPVEGHCNHTRIVEIDDKPCCAAARKLQTMSFVRPTTGKALEWVRSRC